MRIAKVIGRLTIGGAERHFVSLVEALGSEDVDVILLSEPRETDLLVERLPQTCRVCVVPQHKRAAPYHIWQLSRVLRRGRYEIVHSHMFWPNLYTAAATQLAGVPVFVTSEHGENRWKRRWHRIAERQVISRAAAARICVSPQILAARRDRDKVPVEKLHLLYNGTAVPVVAAQGTGAPALVGTVGRFVKEKNLELFIEAASLVKGDFRLCLVGDGKEMGKVRAALERKNLTERAELPGLQSDVSRWLDKMDIFVSSSSQEGHPIALLEAMAYGIACIATDVGGVAGTLEHGHEGMLVPPGDAKALAAAIEELIADRDLRLAMGSAARRRVMRDFSIQAVADRHLKLYERLLESHGTARTGRP